MERRVWHAVCGTGALACDGFTAGGGCATSPFPTAGPFGRLQDKGGAVPHPNVTQGISQGQFKTEALLS